MGESPALPPGHAPWQPASPIIPALRHGQSLGEFSAGRRNSQCINMQKRCINCFITMITQCQAQIFELVFTPDANALK
uniref:Uncharacterized protein n=1 Tax=Zonotrichia albicollis TaxID=44394 RepID=A0A8D2NI42_ZONAL